MDDEEPMNNFGHNAMHGSNRNDQMLRQQGQYDFIRGYSHSSNEQNISFAPPSRPQAQFMFPSQQVTGGKRSFSQSQDSPMKDEYSSTHDFEGKYDNNDSMSHVSQNCMKRLRISGSKDRYMPSTGAFSNHHAHNKYQNDYTDLHDFAMDSALQNNTRISSISTIGRPSSKRPFSFINEGAPFQDSNTSIDSICGENENDRPTKRLSTVSIDDFEYSSSAEGNSSEKPMESGVSTQFNQVLGNLRRERELRMRKQLQLRTDKKQEISPVTSTMTSTALAKDRENIRQMQARHRTSRQVQLQSHSNLG